MTVWVLKEHPKHSLVNMTCWNCILGMIYLFKIKPVATVTTSKKCTYKLQVVKKKIKNKWAKPTKYCNTKWKCWPETMSRTSSLTSWYHNQHETCIQAANKELTVHQGQPTVIQHYSSYWSLFVSLQFAHSWLAKNYC